MKDDFLVEMGYPGLTARLKRLNDQFVYQTKEFYKIKGLEIDPNWHMVFLLLLKYEELTVMEIAERLNLSHPAIVKLINKMKEKGYIKSKRDKEDLRKYHLKLSEKAQQELPQFEQYWKAGNRAVEEMMNHSKKLLDLLEEVEDNMEKMDFTRRMEENYQKLNKKTEKQ